MTNPESAFSVAARKARFGHRDWLVWRAKDGEMVAAVRTADSIKAAMLATGTQGKFTWLAASTASPMVVRWWLAVNLLNNAKRGY